MKTHLKILGIDARSQGQTDYGYRHQTACGYVRDSVTEDVDAVDCFYCLQSSEMTYARKLNNTFGILLADE